MEIGKNLILPDANEALSPSLVVETLPKAVVSTLASAALSMYTGEINPESGLREIDPDLLGKTNLEVMSIKLMETAAQGNLNAINMVYDRLVGKPKQYVESTNMNVSYTDWLDSLAKEQNQPVDIDFSISKNDIPFEPKYTPTETTIDDEYDAFLDDL